MEKVLMALVIIWVYGFGFYLGWTERKNYFRRNNESKSNSV